MLEEISNIKFFYWFKVNENISVNDFLEKVKNKERRLMGFGHRVYKNFDPRATTMASICH